MPPWRSFWPIARLGRGVITCYAAPCRASSRWCWRPSRRPRLGCAPPTRCSKRFKPAIGQPARPFARSPPRWSWRRTGRYWRAGDTVRIQEGEEGKWTADYLVKGGETRAVSRLNWSGGKPRYHDARRRPASDLVCLCDLWREMLIELVVSGGGQVSYDSMLEATREYAATRRERREGRAFVKVSRTYRHSSGDEVQFTLWHDVGCNYLIRKLESYYPKYGSGGTAAITEFAEPQPGVFVPVRAVIETTSFTKQKSVRVTSVADLRVNETMSPATLALPPIPNGTVLDDTIRGTNGKVRSDWQPIGPQGKADGVQVGPSDSPRESSVWDAPSTSEPASVWWWVTAVAGGTLAISLGLLLVSRMRAARAE
jgi:hypothetical protein